MSMLAETSAMKKPLHIFDMGDGERPWWRSLHNYRYKPLSHRFAMRFGPVRMRRDVGRIQQALVGSGRANWLGQAAVNCVETDGNPSELAHTATRVRQLID